MFWFLLYFSGLYCGEQSLEQAVQQKRQSTLGLLTETWKQTKFKK
jgi:hypothetical protein